ncbi:hypothetical protein BASA62_004280 [Batrachochytrium salamandrivorans]|nr:hypothetical protein BASA62_004280 [Batrachochytrium salamandrivorans]
MIRHTLIARESDGLPLVASIENDAPQEPIVDAKKLIKPLIRLLSSYSSVHQHTPSRYNAGTNARSTTDSHKSGAGAASQSYNLPLECTLMADPFVFHYIVDGGAIFVCIADASMPRLLVFSYLLELINEFMVGTNDRSSQWRTASRPYSLIRLEPTLQSIKTRYSNPRALQSRTDLADLSFRVRSIPSMNMSAVLPSEFAAASKVTLGRVVEKVSHAAEQFSVGTGYSEVHRSWRTRYLVVITLCILIADTLFFGQAALAFVRIIRHSKNKGAKIFELVVSNVRQFQTRQPLVPIAAKITLTHACIALAQVLNVLVFPNDLPAWHSSADHISLTPLQQAAMFFRTFSLPAPVVFLKVLYIITVWLVVWAPEGAFKAKSDKLGHME